MSYVIHGRVRSRAMRALWMLEEVEADYRIVPAAPRDEALKAVSPLGKVPALETPEGPVFDSTAILHFLGDRHGRATHPAGSHARARQDEVTFAALEMLDAPLWEIAKNRFVLPEAMRVPEAVEPLRAQVSHFSEAVAGLVEGPFACGETFTLADIVLAHCTGWAMGLKIRVDDRLADHARRMRDRPAFERAQARGSEAEAA